MDQRPDEGVARAVARLEAAMNRLMAGDATAIKALYSQRADVTGFYGWGGYEVGWPEVSRRWDWAATQFQGGGPVTYQTLSTVVTADLAYTTAIETIRVRVAGLDQPKEWSNRVTHVFRREDGEWRLAHRHANRLEDRYRPATRLG
jgi:ketosteroid isomerase-like protein